MEPVDDNGGEASEAKTGQKGQKVDLGHFIFLRIQGGSILFAFPFIKGNPLNFVTIYIGRRPLDKGGLGD